MKNIINEGLEDSWGVGLTEGHNQELIMSSGCVVSRLSFVPFLDPNQMIGIVEIQFCEDRRPLKQFKGGCDEWQGVTALHSDVVEAPVIDAWPQRHILLIHEIKPCSSE